MSNAFIVELWTDTEENKSRIVQSRNCGINGGYNYGNEESCKEAREEGCEEGCCKEAREKSREEVVPSGRSGARETVPFFISG